MRYIYIFSNRGNCSNSLSTTVTYAARRTFHQRKLKLNWFRSYCLPPTPPTWCLIYLGLMRVIWLAVICGRNTRRGGNFRALKQSTGKSAIPAWISFLLTFLWQIPKHNRARYFRFCVKVKENLSLNTFILLDIFCLTLMFDFFDFSFLYLRFCVLAFSFDYFSVA